MVYTNESDERIDDGTARAIDERLFKTRTVIITGGINDKLAHRIVSQLIILSDESDEPIDLFISSPGGHVESGDMVHDVIKFIRAPVRTIGSGWVASAGTLIFVGADIQNRFCLPNTRFLLHQPSGGINGSAADIEIQAGQLTKMRERFEILFANATGQTAEKIREDTKRDFWLDTRQAIDYGLLGSVIQSVDQLPS